MVSPPRQVKVALAPGLHLHRPGSPGGSCPGSPLGAQLAGGSVPPRGPCAVPCPGLGVPCLPQRLPAPMPGAQVSGLERSQRWDVASAGVTGGTRCHRRQWEAADPEVTSCHCLKRWAVDNREIPKSSFGCHLPETKTRGAVSLGQPHRPWQYPCGMWTPIQALSTPTLLAPCCIAHPPASPHLPPFPPECSLGQTQDPGLNPLLYCAQLVQAPPRRCSAPGVPGTTSVPPHISSLGTPPPTGPPASRQCPSCPSGVPLPPTAPSEPQGGPAAPYPHGTMPGGGGTAWPCHPHRDRFTFIRNSR